MGQHTDRGKTWSEMSARRKAVGAAGGLLQVALMVAALNDLRKRRPDDLNGPKAVWVAASFVNFVGPVAYFIFGRKR